MKNRHIHLDFHTSPWITGVGEKFDAEKFAQMMKEAHVENVNLFSKCHHGMAYFPSKIIPGHPHLKSGLDMMGEMINALHKKGITACIYTTVAWEENIAKQFPQWRQMHEDGSFANMDPSPDGVTIQPGKWKFIDFAFEEFQNYYEAHLIELAKNYNADGYWIDIVFYYPNATWSDACKEIREKLNLTGNSMTEHYQVEYHAQVQFAKRMTSAILKHQPNASVFYNTPNNRFVDAQTGVMGKTRHQTHIEIESLPTGFWGYHHFPRNGRHLRLKHDKWLSMTGKFQKMWGDFGGIKPRAALEYECFKPQAMGGAVCIGDQLHPNGELDKATYNLIQTVYADVKKAEPFYKDTKILKEVAVVTPNHISKSEEHTGKSEEGVVMLLESIHYEVDILDDESEFDGYKLVILPDEVVITASLKIKLNNYQNNGGKLLITYNSLFDNNGNEALDFFPVKFEGYNDMKPTYWHTGKRFQGDQFEGIRVIYNQGINATSKELDVWIDRIDPYFKRSELKFSSHFQAPPNKKAKYPAVFGNEKFVYIADPIFREYRQSGNYFVKICFKEIINQLIGKPSFGYGMSPDIFKSALRKNGDLILTLLSYTPSRKALDQDIVENSNNLYGEKVTLTGFEGKIISLLDNIELPVNDGKIKIHDCKGRVILKAVDFF